MKQAVVIKEKIRKKFQEFMENGRIMVFSAPCGFGKTTVAKELLKKSGKRILEKRADEIDVSALSSQDPWDVLLIEDLQLLQSREEYQALCALIQSSHQKRFVFLTRGEIFGALIPYQLSGLLVKVEAEELFFDKALASAFLEGCGLLLRETELKSVMRATLGYPLAMAILAECIKENGGYDARLLEQVAYQIYLYYDEMVYHRFDMPMRRFLLELAPFEKFNTELAKMVSGDAGAGRLLAQLLQNTRMLRFDNADEYYFWPFFRDFLIWKQNKVYTIAQQRALYSRGGLFYELHGNYAKALEYYAKSEEQNKVSELIIKTMEMHPGMGQYEKLENYFLSLPDSIVKESPALMQGKSMLCALHGDYDASEQWYRELEQFFLVRKKSDAAAKEAKSRLTWLDIALPQRGVKGLTETIKSAFSLMRNKEIKLPPFSVTSTLPSIMNGGKDFSPWSKIDDLLYATMRAPVEAVLGKDGVGLADCAIAESKFEKGEDISGKMLALVSKLSEIQNRGTSDIEFALVGLLVRSQLDAGRPQDAKNSLLALKSRFSECDNTRFMPNIDAMLCRVALKSGDMEEVEAWYRTKAPRNVLNFKVMKRYQYLTEALAELVFGDAEGALLTLSPLEPYCARCGRHIDMISLKVIAAIAKYKKQDESFVDDIETALRIAAEYGFVRSISTYGAAVLLPLEHAKLPGNKAFLQKVIKAARGQTIFYPNFLTQKEPLFDKLTETEMQVLRLLCADKSNLEIGEILNIKLATVKSHVSHILQKLGVNRRSEAKTIAEKFRIL